MIDNLSSQAVVNGGDRRHILIWIVNTECYIEFQYLIVRQKFFVVLNILTHSFWIQLALSDKEESNTDTESVWFSIDVTDWLCVKNSNEAASVWLCTREWWRYHLLTVWRSHTRHPTNQWLDTANTCCMVSGITFLKNNVIYLLAWCVIVRASDLQLRGPGFDCWPLYFHITTWNKLFTHVCFCHQAV